MNVIKVGESDVAVIHDILVNYMDSTETNPAQPSVNHLRAFFNDDRSYLFAAMEYNTVVGYALVYRFPSFFSSENLAYLYDIEVSVNHRRKGIGKLLIESVLGYLRLDNVKELWLGTAVDNPAGQGLFASTGAIKSMEAFNDFTYYL